MYNIHVYVPLRPPLVSVSVTPLHMTRVDRHDTTLINIDSKLDDMEQYQRKDNIRIIGLAQNVGEETPAKVVNFIKQTLQIDITIKDINNAHRLPSHDKNTNHKDIIVKFTSHLIKEEVMKNRSKLRGLPDKIICNDDLTKNRSLLYKHAQDAVRNKKALSAWTRDGTIFMKKEENSAPIKINCKIDIDKF